MKTFFSKGWRSLLVLLLLFIAWELIIKIMDIPEWLLPAPSKIFTEAFISWSDLTVHLLSTVNLSVTGFIIGTCIGLLTAVLLYLIPFLKESLYPLLDSVAKYSYDRLGTTVGYLVWFWHATEDHCHHSCLLFSCYCCST